MVVHQLIRCFEEQSDIRDIFTFMIMWACEGLKLSAIHSWSCHLCCVSHRYLLVPTNFPCYELIFKPTRGRPEEIQLLLDHRRGRDTPGGVRSHAACVCRGGGVSGVVKTHENKMFVRGSKWLLCFWHLLAQGDTQHCTARDQVHELKRKTPSNL